MVIHDQREFLSFCLRRIFKAFGRVLPCRFHLVIVQRHHKGLPDRLRHVSGHIRRFFASLGFAFLNRIIYPARNAAHGGWLQDFFPVIRNGKGKGANRIFTGGFGGTGFHR